MPRLLLATATATLALLLASAAPSASVDELVRQGNALFQRKKYDEAVALYELAEARTTDPGLVAFNKAAALYRLGRYRDAELCYRRCLEDGDLPPARRARGLYDLGTSLLQVEDGKNLQALETAVRCLQACRRLATEPDLLARAEYNLELARLLWAKARVSAGKSEQPPNSPEESKGAHQKDDDPTQQHGPSALQKGKPLGKGQALLEDPSKGQQKAVETKETISGRGNLQTLPDTDELRPMDPDDTLAHLERAALRIQREQREQRHLLPRVMPGVKDW